MLLRTLAYNHPDAAKLIAEVQQEYVRRYGDPDITPVDPAEFAAPRGLFLVGYLDGEPVACGGWRVPSEDTEHVLPGDAEMKRMYVVPAARGRGLARRVLAELERTAAEAGHRRMILETGTKQPEAIALYTSAGYQPTTKFGVYRDDENSVCLAKPLVVAESDRPEAARQTPAC
ncbi:GNAT family N-acetyltransferase [Goodfellowiella coeruleoviolacea]|nr:GNAT family N-acetyltransferase [Goodfellowiella coeruleoviolacea]